MAPTRHELHDLRERLTTLEARVLRQRRDGAPLLTVEQDGRPLLSLP